jgi:ribonuclease HI
LLELKFNIYVSCKPQEYAAVIVDNKHKKTVIKQAIQESNLQRVELLAIIDILQHMLEKFDEKTKSYLCVTYYTDSIYCGNILNEWLAKWQPTNFTGRPNADLLGRLVTIVSSYGENLTIHYAPQNSLEYLAISRKELSA